MKVTRAQIIDWMHQQFDAEIPKQVIDDAVVVITECLGDILLESESLSVDNFGTLHSYIIPGHVGQNIATGEKQYLKPQKSVKFSPHVTFSDLLDEKLARFQKKNLDN